MPELGVNVAVVGLNVKTSAEADMAVSAKSATPSQSTIMDLIGDSSSAG
jgi:hypothetical protein